MRCVREECVSSPLVAKGLIDDEVTKNLQEAIPTKGCEATGTAIINQQYKGKLSGQWNQLDLKIPKNATG
ncbi:hypothetical protein TNCV_3321291 [Trichonephila clavipes]|nr:hypothetical protein TNCV_3321291 [Trichonephila clavipes]